MSDLRAYDALRALPRCHQLHYLQMASEKVCKAHLYNVGMEVRLSHAVIRKHLPAVLRSTYREGELSGERLKKLKQLASEIEVLAPACTDNDSRPDNTEYPWQITTGEVLAPMDFSFDEISERDISSFVKRLRSSAQELAS